MSTDAELIDADLAAEIEQATADVCGHQETAEVAASRLAAAKKTVTELAELSKQADADLRMAAKRLRGLREGREPNPERYPMFDRARAEAGDPPPVGDGGVIRETFATLVSLGHPESQVRRFIEKVSQGGRKFPSAVAMVDAIYMHRDDSE